MRIVPVLLIFSATLSLPLSPKADAPLWSKSAPLSSFSNSSISGPAENIVTHENFNAVFLSSSGERNSRMAEENGEKLDESHPKEVSTRRKSSSGHTKRHAKPFSVSIEKENFYGGLVTYSHELHPARICRIMNACIRADGTLVLPEWMQRHDNTLKFHCGHSQLDFSLPDTNPPPPLKKLDLVGLHCPRPSMSDFVTDFMPSTVIFDLIYGDHKVSKSCHSRRGSDCSSFPGLEEGLQPAVILHPRLRPFEQKSWVRQFIKLMKPPHSGRQPKVLFDDTFRDFNADLTCFRSALFTRGPFNKNYIMRDHLRRIHFLAKHGIKKPPRKVLPEPSDENVDHPTCKLNVTISNRRLVDGAHSRLIGRYILNVAKLSEAVLQRATRIPGLQLKVATLCLEGKSLRWQMNAMQKTDIWIAGHGPLLTNMLFLRENSSVVEIQPFAYYPRTYERMAQRLAHVNYERYIADPDVEAFKTCINQLYPDEHPARREASALLDRYTQASKKYFQSDSTHSMVLHGLNDSDLHHVKTCAHMQRLATNTKNFAVAIVRQARLRCGFPKPGLHSVAPSEFNAQINRDQ